MVDPHTDSTWTYSQLNADVNKLSNALLDCVIRLWGCVIGFGAVFSARKDYASVQEIARWGLEVLSGIRNAGRTGYTDKTAAVLTVLLAHAQLHLENAEDARDSLREAAALAASFDASPYYGLSAFRFVSAPKEGSVHDGMGGTAGESVAFILDKLRDPDLASLWEEVRSSVPPQAEEGGKKQ